jgi:pimeloyl-ACP methyl ester carboxylesterase
MSLHADSYPGAVTEHAVPVPGGTIYYRTHGTGPPLILIGGGPSNADTLATLAGHFAADHTVITYDRRGYSRSQLDDLSQPASIAVHASDVRDVLHDLHAGPASVFATSVGALIGLELAASHPNVITRLIVHEPPLGQLVPADDQASFDIELDRDDAGAALDQIATSIGVTRGRSLTGSADLPEARRGDIELFIQRDVPAIADYALDLDLIAPLTDRIVITASEDGREFYPHRCAQALAAALDTPLIELPGNHAAMITHPAQFAARLTPLLPRPDATATVTSGRPQRQPSRTSAA